MKLLAFTDYVYREVDGVIHAERAFALFLAGLCDHFERVTIVGRLDRGDGPVHYRLPDTVRFVALPHYESLTRPGAVGMSGLQSVGVFWHELQAADRVWVLGPQPHAVLLALLTRLRRRPLVLGVRQDFPTYIRMRRPDYPWMQRSANVLERSWRWLARRVPVIVVGSELARQYAHAPALLTMSVSLVSADDIVPAAGEDPPSDRPELRLLTVGRIDREKNPLLLADIFALLRAVDGRWRLTVCGEGPLTEPLSDRLAKLGVADYAELKGYVPIDGGLLELYRSSDAFLHVSLTEGMPQVLIEAFAAGVPVVATAVGGVPDAAGDAALLVAPDNARAAADALLRIATEPGLARRLVEAGLIRARAATLEGELARVAAFITAAGR